MRPDQMPRQEWIEPLDNLKPEVREAVELEGDDTVADENRRLRAEIAQLRDELASRKGSLHAS